MSTPVVIDLQGFSINNQFIPKEIAAFNGQQISHHIFKPPGPFRIVPDTAKKDINWLIANHHCIVWNEGSTSLKDFQNIITTITRSSNIIYVKGREKANYLRKFTTKQVLELDEQPTLKKNQPKCYGHLKDPCMCALTNVLYLFNVFIKKKEL